MKQYSFIQESMRKLTKKIGNYSADIRKRIISKIPRFQKLEEYYQKMFNGQITRLEKIGQKYGFTTKVLPEFNTSNTIRSHINSKTKEIVIIIPSKPNPNIKFAQNWSQLADTMSHEIDEVSLQLAQAKKLSISPDAIGSAAGKQMIPYRSKKDIKLSGAHNIGVLQREMKRGRMLKIIDPNFQPIERSVWDLEANRKPNEYFMKHLDKWR